MRVRRRAAERAGTYAETIRARRKGEGLRKLPYRRRVWGRSSSGNRLPRANYTAGLRTESAPEQKAKMPMAIDTPVDWAAALAEGLLKRARPPRTGRGESPFFWKRAI